MLLKLFSGADRCLCDAHIWCTDSNKVSDLALERTSLCNVSRYQPSLREPNDIDLLSLELWMIPQTLTCHLSLSFERFDHGCLYAITHLNALDKVSKVLG